MDSPSLITTEGADRLRKELGQLERVERQQITEAIGRARALGDLSENAEYHAAKEKQGMVEARIRLLRQCLGTARPIDTSQLKDDGTVRFGMRVHLLKLDDEREMLLQIVGELESDAAEGRISLSAPVAKALMGRQVEDVVSVQTPDGTLEYEILAISVPSAA